MKTAVVLAVVAMVASHAVAELAPGLRVKFNVGLRPGTDFFFDVPRTISQAVQARWSLTPRLEGHLPSLSLYCHSDLNVCVYFDDTGNVAGLQIALDQSKFKDNPYDMKVSGFKEWEVTDRSGQVRKFWVTAMYFVSKDYLELPASVREEKRDSSKFLQEDVVWVTGYDGAINMLYGDESEIQKTIFTRQACIPWMGRHYYYNMRKDTKCSASTLYPWFPITDTGKIRALGLMVVGNYPTNASSQDWFEHPPTLAVKLIVPNGPECLYDLASKPGVTTMHVYFVDKPWNIGCPLF